MIGGAVVGMHPNCKLSDSESLSTCSWETEQPASARTIQSLMGSPRRPHSATDGPHGSPRLPVENVVSATSCLDDLSGRSAELRGRSPPVRAYDGGRYLHVPRVTTARAKGGTRSADC